MHPTKQPVTPLMRLPIHQRAEVICGSADVIRALTRLQKDPALHRPRFAKYRRDPEVLRGLLCTLVNSFHQRSNYLSVNESDSTLIDIFYLMYRHLEHDRSMPEVFLELMQKLKIPLLKALLLDRYLLDRSNHPVTGFIDLLAHTFNCWNNYGSCLHDPLTIHSQRWIKKINRNFDNSFCVFQDCLQELQAFRAADRPAEAVNPALRKQVSDEIQNQLSRQRLPFVVSAFIRGPWQQVLYRVINRDGDTSPSWNHALGVLRGLIRHSLPPTLTENRAAPENTMKVLLRELDYGCNLISCNRNEQIRFLQDLQEWHSREFQRSSQTGETSDTAVSSRTGADQPEDSTDEFGQHALLAQIEQATGRLEQQAGRRGSGSASGSRRAEAVTLGSWLLFTGLTPQGFRAKLGWKDPVLGIYTFVDRHNKPVYDCAINKLEEGLHTGHIRVLDDAPLFTALVSRTNRYFKMSVGKKEKK